MTDEFDAVCAGLVCLDVTPEFPEVPTALGDVFAPGRLTNIGNLTLSLGGSVSNTGLAMNRLGVPTCLMTKTGDDWLGDQVGSLLRRDNVAALRLVRAPGETSSYCVVIAVPGNDRIFLYNPGVADTFAAADMDFEAVGRARLMHFGYPTAMRNMFLDGGTELRDIFAAAKRLGVTTSLDTSYPGAEAREQDWRAIFAAALPFTDIFTPSLEELLLMFDREHFLSLTQDGGDALERFDIDRLPGLAHELFALGAGVVAVKCGTRGYYLAAADSGRLERAGAAFTPRNIAAWAGCEVFSGIFRVDKVISACGAGDTSVAALLASILRGFPPKRAVDTACAVGALCCTALSTTDAIPTLDTVGEKIAAGWEKRPAAYAGEYFMYDETARLYSRRRR